jgi:adenylate kinase family enzyme
VTAVHPPDRQPLERQLIAVAGRTRAGKTTLATALSHELDLPQTSFSSYVRATAVSRQLGATRQVLQDLGAEMIERLGPRGFVEGALDHAGLTPDDAPFVIEGVRHVTVLEAMREVAAPLPVTLIYLAVSDEERNRRLAAEGISAAEGSQWEKHSTEYDVLHRLQAEADLVIDADQPRDFVANTALDWLRRE